MHVVRNLRSCCVFFFNYVMLAVFFVTQVSPIKLSRWSALIIFLFFFSSPVVLPRSLCKLLQVEPNCWSLAMLIHVLLVSLLLSIGFLVSSNSCLGNSLISSSHLFLVSELKCPKGGLYFLGQVHGSSLESGTVIMTDGSGTADDWDTGWWCATCGWAYRRRETELSDIKVALQFPLCGDEWTATQKVFAKKWIFGLLHRYSTARVRSLPQRAAPMVFGERDSVCDVRSRSARRQLHPCGGVRRL